MAELGARSYSEGSGKWIAADPHSGQLLGLGVLVAVEPPVGDVRFGELLAQKAEAGDLHRVPPLLPRIRFDGEELRLEQIAGLGPLDEDRAR